MTAQALVPAAAPAAPRLRAHRIARAAGAFSRDLARRVRASGAYYAAATTLATLLALYIAFLLELDSPSTAATTVLIVASPIRGMILSKSLYRLLGTFVGGAVALLLVELCGQYSELFFAAVALWVGVCTAVAAFFRNFRSYAAVLAGYTVPLIGMAAIQAPDRAFDIASARLAAITVGVVCAAFAGAWLQPGGARADLVPRLRDAISAVLCLARDALARDMLARSGEAVAEGRFVEITRHILGLDDLIEFAAAESPSAARQSDALRSAVGALIGAVTTLRAMADAQAEKIVSANALIGDIHAALEDMSGRIAQGDRNLVEPLAAMRRRLRLALDRAADRPLSLHELQWLDNLAELIEQVEAALLDLEAYEAGRGGHSVAVIDYHVDAQAALGNGLRAFLGVLAASAFCYSVGWSDAAQAPVAVAVICSLLAMSPNPAKASIAFGLGVLLGDLAAVFCQFVLLARADGFPLLALSMAPFVFVGLLNPPSALLRGISGGFRIFFVVALSPTNPMNFDAAATLNTVLVSIVGAVFAAYFYRAILPLDENAEPRRLLRQIRAQIARSEPTRAQDRLAFESRLYHLLTLLAARLDAESAEGRALLAEAYATTRLALAKLRGRIALSGEELSEETRLFCVPLIDSAEDAEAFSKAATLLVARMQGAADRDRSALVRAAAAMAEAATIAGAPQMPIISL